MKTFKKTTALLPRNKTQAFCYGLIVCIMAMIFTLIFTGCGNSETSREDGQTTIIVRNWNDYIHPDVIGLFEAEYPHIRVDYAYFVDNESLHTVLSRGAAEFDLVFPSDYMIERMISEEMLNRINWDNIPNVSYLGERFRGLQYDPDDLYSVPYMWGTFGILYNPQMLEDLGFDFENETVDSWEILWDERFSQNIFMYDIARESFVVALQRLGYSANSTDISELERARDSLIEQRPLVQAYVATDGMNKMIAEEGAMAAIYNGYAIWAIQYNPDLRFTVPKEGGMQWYDSMVIPNTSRNQAETETFINFLLRPDIARMNAEFTRYSVSNMSAFELLSDDKRNDPVYWPSEDVLANAETLSHLGEFVATFDNFWTQVLAS